MRIFLRNPIKDMLGPGERYGLWLQGCHRRCKGCIAEHAQDVNGGQEVDETVLANEILNSKVEGITISGGEPFLQADKINRLLRFVREYKPDIGVIVYTGYKYEDLIGSKDQDVALLACSVDTIIDGEYIEELDDDKSQRGSSNQRAIMITDKYQEFYDREFGKSGRSNTIQLNGKSVLMIGIPNKLTKKIIKQMEE